jgi:hypothetical protein
MKRPLLPNDAAYLREQQWWLLCALDTQGATLRPIRLTCWYSRLARIVVSRNGDEIKLMLHVNKYEAFGVSRQDGDLKALHLYWWELFSKIMTGEGAK